MHSSPTQNRRPSRRCLRTRQAVLGLVLAGATGFALSLYDTGAHAADGNGAKAQSPVVVELFTSQGCNSCPPADRMIDSLADREGLVVLSLHVDYWDYIGWEDPYGSPKHTARQKAYADSLDQRMVYTPQIMVDGARDVMGARRGEVEMAISQARAAGKPLDVRLTERQGGLIVVPAGEKPARPAGVWLAVYDDRVETAVPRGENAGKRLVNRHVVRELKRIGTWNGERLEIPVDLAGSAAAGRDGCAVLVQEGGVGRVLGAAMMEFPG